MVFEYDPAKSQSNKTKHGMDFETAKALWDDEGKILIDSSRKDEPRTIVVGQINGLVWAMVITYREEAVRIISCRRARKEEVALYAQSNSH